MGLLTTLQPQKQQLAGKCYISCSTLCSHLWSASRNTRPVA